MTSKDLVPLASEHCDAAATLFTYPDADKRGDVLRACETLVGCDSFPADAVQEMRAYLMGNEPEELEEQFTRTFDINPLCTLEIGWHLYGEDYARGAFLVEMRQLMRELGVEETTELPDHLHSILRVLGRLHPLKAEGLSSHYLQPALLKMIDGYEEPTSPYHKALQGLLEALEVHFGKTDPLAIETPTTQAVPYECGASCSPLAAQGDSPSCEQSPNL